MVSTQMLMFLYMFTGVIAARARIITKETRPGLIGLLLNVALPCMVLNSFQQDVGAEQLIGAAQALIISAACCVGALFIGRWRWRNKPDARKPVMLYTTMLSNQGYAGMPVVALVYGAEGVFYTSFFLIPVRILIWTVGISLFVKQEGKAKWKTLLLNPSLIAVFVGFLFLLTPMRLPSVVSTAVANLGSLTGPLSMIVIGASLSSIQPKEMLDLDLWQLCLVRLIALPMLAMVILRLLGVSDILWQVESVLLAMPAATNCAIFAEKYGQDHVFGAKCVFVSTVLSLVTVPVLALLF